VKQNYSNKKQSLVFCYLPCLFNAVISTSCNHARSVNFYALLFYLLYVLMKARC